MLADFNLISIHKKLIDWFKVNQRQLPWREDYHPYKTWISEIMLQQTQVATVIDYFNKWYHYYPNIDKLKQAKLEDLNRIWQGLGYYSRCLNIYKTAQTIHNQYLNQFPDSKAKLLKLPGIGDYTAGAILSIAFNQKEPIVDGNIKRVFARIFAYKQDIKTKQAYDYFKNIATELVNLGQPRQINQSLMELGALVCSKAKPKCSICPTNQYCQAFKNQLTTQIPLTIKSSKVNSMQMYYYVLQIANKILIVKNINTQWWKNYYGFSYFTDKNNPIELWLKKNSAKLIHQKNYKHKVTNNNINAECMYYQLEEKIDFANNHEFEYLWLDKQNLNKLPMYALANKIRMNLE